MAQLATHSDGLVAVPIELCGMVHDSWLRGLLVDLLAVMPREGLVHLAHQAEEGGLAQDV